MTDEKKVHPMRRKHRRGKRGGKKHRQALVIAPPVPTPPPAISALRNRLSLLKQVSHG